MLLLPFFLMLPSLVYADGCSVDTNGMNSENAFIKCVPDLIDGSKAKPSTVCVITCKENNLRFKHRCNRNGQWDQDPVFEKCGTVVTCPHPNTNASWNNWQWNCPGLSQGSKCNGVCKLNSGTNVQISCGKDKKWTTDGPDLEDVALCPARGKLIIVGGNEGNYTNVTEILDLDDERSTCNVPSAYPFQALGIQAGVLDSKPIFCGGDDDIGDSSKECFEYSTQGFKSFSNLTYEADGSASSAVVHIDNQDALWISGGINMGNKSQLVYSNGTISKGPVMPEMLAYHCVVATNKTTVLAIGGVPDNSSIASNKTYWYNFELSHWSNGPELLHERYRHACGGVFYNSSNLMIAVIGGKDNQGRYLSTVEFAVLDQDNTPAMTWEWKYGPQFPFQVISSTAVSINSKLYVIGGYRKQASGYSFSNMIHELAENITWIEFPQKMTIARSRVAAISLPEELVTCENRHPSSNLARRNNDEL